MIRRSGSEPRQGTARHGDEFDLTMNTEKATEPKQQYRKRMDFKAQTTTSATMGTILCTVAKIVGQESHQSAARIPESELTSGSGR